MVSLGGYADIFLRNTLASGSSLRSAPSWAVRRRRGLLPALTDFIFMVRNSSYMFVTGPEWSSLSPRRMSSFEELGGADVHARSRASATSRRQRSRLPSLIRKLLSFLPQNNMEDPPFVPTQDDPLRTETALDTIVPEDPSKPYDLKTSSA